jgi:mannose-6-phosphate isomerase-like protein (cupin superfamily)
MDDARGKLVEVLKGSVWKQLNYLTIKKGDVRGKHYHKKLVELFYVLQGAVRFDIKNMKTGETQDFVMKAGECVIIEPDDYHVLTALEDLAMVSLYSEEFDPKDLHSE